MFNKRFFVNTFVCRTSKDCLGLLLNQLLIFMLDEQCLVFNYVILIYFSFLLLHIRLNIELI